MELNINKEKILEELKKFGIFLVICLIILKITFYKSSFVEVFSLLITLQFFIIPGLLLTYYFFKKQNLPFYARIAISYMFGVIILGVIGYYLPLLFGLHISKLTPWSSIIFSLLIAIFLIIKNVKK